ncbi:MAG: hypothetical protein J0L92_19435 [Deltaproteobacteria bacterium]|nr:hypothetical protein [Deltaproteobacteria bacterium]
MTTHDNGRRFERELAPLVKEENGLVILRAPRPGLLRDAPTKGRALREGERCGELEVLGTLTKLVVPAGVAGLVVEENVHSKLARKPVAYGDVIAVIDPKAVAGGVAATGGASASTATGGLVWKTPLGGRYYGRPSPSAEPFVKVGDVIKTGQTVALVEVMKTFNRASYGGAGLPSEARVTRILVNEGDDVNGGDAILALEVV